MPEIYIKIFLAFLSYLFLIRLASGGKAFNSWGGFFSWHIFALVILAFLELCSGGAFFGVITVFSP